MQREIIQPRDENHWLELRRQDITSTEVGALFGLSDSAYIPTLFELWHRKKGNFSVEFEPNDRVKWGKRMEATIAAGVAEDQGWTIRHMKEYMRIPGLRIGASFDFSIERIVPGDHLTATEIMGGGLLEVKNVDSLIVKQKWLIDGDNIEAPPAIELQLQHQLLVSGRSFGYIAAMVGGNKVILIRREADQAIHDAICKRAADFWISIESGHVPKPDFERDADFIPKLMGYAEPGKIFNADPKTEEMMSIYKQYHSAESIAKKGKEEVKARILMTIGDAEKVIGSDWSISAGVVGPVEIEAHTRKGFRNFRPFFKKITNE